MKQFKAAWILILMFLLMVIPLVIGAEGQTNGDVKIYLPAVNTPARKWVAAYDTGHYYYRDDRKIALVRDGRGRYKVVGDGYVLYLDGSGKSDDASYITFTGEEIAAMSNGRFVKAMTQNSDDCDHDVTMFSQDDSAVWARGVKLPGSTCSTSNLSLAAGSRNIFTAQPFSARFAGFSSWFTMIDENGDLAWSKLIGKGWVGGPFAMASTMDNGLIFTAFRSGETYEILLGELDNAGQIVSARKFVPASGEGILYTPHAISSTPNEGIILAGSSCCRGGEGDLWAIKLDKNWNISWQVQFKAPLMHRADLAIGQRDGGVLLGQSMFGRYLLKLHADGSAAWLRYFGDQDRYMSTNTVVEEGNGSMLVTGKLQKSGQEAQLFSMRLGRDGLIANCDLISSGMVEESDLGFVMSATTVEMQDVSANVSKDSLGFSGAIEAGTDLLCSSRAAAVDSNCRQ